MLSQQKADGEILALFGKVISIVLLLSLLSILGYKYFGAVSNIGSQGLKVDHHRLLNVLGMVKAQWLAKGRPSEMRLDWDMGGEYASSFSANPVNQAESVNGSESDNEVESVSVNSELQNSSKVMGKRAAQSTDVNFVKMSSGGWPLPKNLDSLGCEHLWYQLLGENTASQHLVSEIGANGDVCSYIASNYDRLGYHLRSGRVIFLTNDAE